LGAARQLCPGADPWRDVVGGIEPFRKALTYSERLNGYNSSQAECLRRERMEAMQNAALARLRFRQLDRVRVTSGQYAGRIGTIKELYLSHTAPYLISTEDGIEVQAADSEVEPAA